MQFENILFPVDFSDSCLALKADVEWLANKFNSTVTLMHVFEIPPAWYGMGDAYSISSEWIVGVMEEAKKRLDAFSLNLPANRMKRVVLEGQPAGEIRTWCRTHPVDLVAMATHGHGAFEGLLMGSVTAKSLHNLKEPLWLWPSEGAVDRKREGEFRIVCGIGSGEEGFATLSYAKKLADAFQAKVTLVHSVPEETRPSRYLDTDFHQYLKESAQKEITEQQARAGTNFELVVSDHEIGTALVDTTEEKGADLVLIGRGHARKFLGRFRTHTYDLLSHVTCPVFSFCPEETTHPDTKTTGVNQAENKVAI